MEFFGLTSYGVGDPVKDFMRPDYKEPEIPPTNLLEAGDDSKSFCERIKEIDCYIGFTDGYSYKSWDRLARMKKKYVIKPVGPCEMYKYPGVTSMNYGWFQCNSDLKNINTDDNWFKPRTRYPVTTSEMSRYIDHCLKVDKHFKI
ncbi:hypothetical protein NQ318_012572 [Aromia moschata]|uniref:Uncharacterized protein n=1 Tax=Aromia moschata TaxID=1265417 RepID=A0AAV8YKS2_9CUCU|nr:hypothetical protein NQ318_012572 [Aromia moschata]